MKRLLNKILNTTPKQWINKIRFFFIGEYKKEIINNQWHAIKKGMGKGIKLFIDPLAFKGWQEMIHGDYDSFLYEELLNIADPKDKIIWDIGAHFGYHTLIFSKLVGDKGKVIAFEPNSFNYQRLQKHIKYNDDALNIKTFPYAISDKNGQSNFIFSDNIDYSQSTGSHLDEVLPPQKKELYKKFNFQEEYVKTMTSDTVIEEENNIIPDIIKVDIEGAEFNFLKGAQTLIENHHPIILMEVHNIVAMYSVQNFLNSLQYNIQLIDKENASISRCFIIAFK